MRKHGKEISATLFKKGLKEAAELANPDKLQSCIFKLLLDGNRHVLDELLRMCETLYPEWFSEDQTQKKPLSSEQQEIVKHQLDYMGLNLGTLPERVLSQISALEECDIKKLKVTFAKNVEKLASLADMRVDKLCAELEHDSLAPFRYFSVGWLKEEMPKMQDRKQECPTPESED